MAKVKFNSNFYIIAIVGISAILIIECFAIHHGVNGTMFGASMAGIGAIVGYAAKVGITIIKKRG